jgi:hypothetical protein
VEVIKVSAIDYAKIVGGPYHAFGLSEFNLLNEQKVDEVFYLLFKDTKYRLSIIGGFKDGLFKSPFSAPFGGFNYLSKNTKIQYLDDAISSLKNWMLQQNGKSIEVTLPPAIYSESFIVKQSSAFYRGGFELQNMDLNYSFKTSDFTESYKSNIWRSAKKSLNIAIKNGLKIKLCVDEEEKYEAFKIIKENREFKGFPLKMTWSQLLETSNVIKYDVFQVIDELGDSIAAAIVFHVTSDVVQVVYWGDRPGFTHLKPINYMSFKVFEYYANKVDYVDIGPSTENSIPNFGLCEFKESIGCGIQYKFTFKINLLENMPNILRL